MKLSRPSCRAFWVSVVLVVLGLLGRFGGLRLAWPYNYWLLLGGYFVLFLSVVFKRF